MMKTLIAGILVASAVTLGGCHVFKQPPVRQSAGVTVIQKASQPAVTIQSLDARVTALEDRLNKARAARAAAAKAAAAPVAEVKVGHRYFPSFN